MLIDDIKLASGSKISNASIEYGDTLPTDGLYKGRTFYLVDPNTNTISSQYVWNGESWMGDAQLEGLEDALALIFAGV